MSAALLTPSPTLPWKRFSSINRFVTIPLVTKMLEPELGPGRLLVTNRLWLISVGAGPVALKLMPTELPVKMLFSTTKLVLPAMAKTAVSPPLRVSPSSVTVAAGRVTVMMLPGPVSVVSWAGSVRPVRASTPHWLPSSVRSLFTVSGPGVGPGTDVDGGAGRGGVDRRLDRRERRRWAGRGRDADDDRAGRGWHRARPGRRPQRQRAEHGASGGDRCRPASLVTGVYRHAAPPSRSPSGARCG